MRRLGRRYLHCLLGLVLRPLRGKIPRITSNDSELALATEALEINRSPCILLRKR